MLMFNESKVTEYKGYRIYRVEDKEPDDFEVWKSGKKVVSCETETAAKEWIDNQVNESRINKMVSQIIEGKSVRKVLCNLVKNESLDYSLPYGKDIKGFWSENDLDNALVYVRKNIEFKQAVLDKLRKSSDFDIISGIIKDGFAEDFYKYGSDTGEQFINAYLNVAKKYWRNTLSEEIEKVEILGIGLLSQLKYDKYKMRIPKLGDSWWLASAIVDPSDESVCGALVWDDDRVICRYVAMYYAVRPMLDVVTDLEPGRKFKWKDHTWTVITKNFALCDESFTNMMFRKDADAKDASEYAKSDIKKWLDNWWDSHGKKNRTKVEIL